MRVLKNIWSQVHLYLLWLLASALIWGLTFSFLTDAKLQNRARCYLTYTNGETHRILRENTITGSRKSGRCSESTGSMSFRSS